MESCVSKIVLAMNLMRPHSGVILDNCSFLTRRMFSGRCRPAMRSHGCRATTMHARACGRTDCGAREKCPKRNASNPAEVHEGRTPIMGTLAAMGMAAVCRLRGSKR